MKVRAITAMAHVQSVNRSIDFYAKLGFTVENSVTPAGHNEPSWAWLQSGDAALMVTRASGPVVASQQAVLFYVYCDDASKAREDLQAKGVPVGELCIQPWAARGEFRIEDPDGYVVMVTHT